LYDTGFLQGNQTGWLRLLTASTWQCGKNCQFYNNVKFCCLPPRCGRLELNLCILYGKPSGKEVNFFLSYNTRGRIKDSERVTTNGCPHHLVRLFNIIAAFMMSTTITSRTNYSIWPNIYKQLSPPLMNSSHSDKGDFGKSSKWGG